MVVMMFPILVVVLIRVINNMTITIDREGSWPTEKLVLRRATRSKFLQFTQHVGLGTGISSRTHATVVCCKAPVRFKR